MSAEAFENIVSFSHLHLKGALKLNTDSIAWKDKKGNTTVSVAANDIIGAEWTAFYHDCELKILLEDGDTKAFRGFSEKDQEPLSRALQTKYNVEMKVKHQSIIGRNWGEATFEGKSALRFDNDGKTVFTIPLSDVSQAVLQPKQKHEVALEFHDGGVSRVEDEELTEIRLWLPGSAETDEPAKKFQTTLVERAGINEGVSSTIVSFSELNFLLPRARYDVEMYSTYLRLQGRSYDYKIRYSSILQLYKLPRVDISHDILLISVDPPVRQGNTTYPHLIASFPREESLTVELNMDEESLKSKYDGTLSRDMEGAKVDVVAMIFRALSGKKLISKTPYKNEEGQAAIRCSLKQNEGQLFLLEKRFVFVFKPVVIINYKDIATLEITRMSATGAGRVQTQNFDLNITSADGSVYQFGNIRRTEYDTLMDFVKSKNIKVKNITPTSAVDAAIADLGEEDGEDYDSEDEDEDFHVPENSSGSEPEMSDAEVEPIDAGQKPKAKKKRKKEDVKGEDVKDEGDSSDGDKVPIKKQKVEESSD